MTQQYNDEYKEVLGKEFVDKLSNSLRTIAGKKEFDAKKYSHKEEYLCSAEQIKSGDSNIYRNYANADILWSDSLEEAINKCITLLNFNNTENRESSLYISSRGLYAVSPLDEDEGYTRITEPSQIKISKDNNLYKITKEYGNIFDDQKEKIKHEIDIIKHQTKPKLNKTSNDHKYYKERADNHTKYLINQHFSKPTDSKNQPKVFNYQSGLGAKTNKGIKLELCKYKPRNLLFLFSKKSVIGLVARGIEENLKYTDSEIARIDREVSNIYHKRDCQIIQEKKKFRTINRLEKTMQFTLKDGEKFTLLETPIKVMDRKSLDNNYTKLKSLKIKS